VYGRLKNGWYGLRSLVWTLVVMALVRIKRPEQIKHHDPVGLGCVLGLPRAAEVKTIRRKLNEITQRGRAAEWHRRLARHWYVRMIARSNNQRRWPRSMSTAMYEPIMAIIGSEKRTLAA